jgi:CRISPR-associated protein Csd2
MTTTTAIHLDPTKRHDFVLLFDVTDGNPNGDPDADNLPRSDPQTLEGLVTDVAIKRKVRDYVDIARGEEQRFKIYVQHGQYLTDTRTRVFKDRADGRADKDVKTSEARDWMCDEFFDVRMFGAVMSMSEKNAGQVRGPLQLTFARSIDPIMALDEAITGPAQNQKQSRPKEGDETDRFGTMGRKTLIPYGLYWGYGFFNPHFAQATGATSEDLDLFWNALIMMWDHARSSSKGLMGCRGVYVFTHDNPLGNAPAQTLLERIAVRRRDEGVPARKFQDYEVIVGEASLPAGITLTRLGC